LSAFDGLSLFRLRVFTAVAEEGGYAAAARALDVAQPTVIFHVRALNQIYKSPLLLVQNRKIVLTPAGQVVYRAAKLMLRDASNLERAVEEVRDGQVGQLKVGASMALEMPSFLEHVLAPFHRAHSRVQLAIHFGHSVDLAERVHNRELDLAYILSFHFPKGIHHERLHDADFVYVVAPHHPLARLDRVRPQQIADAGIIAAPIDSLTWANFTLLMRASGVEHPNIAVEMDGFQARVLAAQAGWGVLGMFVPPFARESPLVGLQRLRLELPPPRAEFSLVTLEESLWTPILASFVQWLRHTTGVAGVQWPPPAQRARERWS
jgi:DNA-binding transcriptional LysR family regulator